MTDISISYPSIKAAIVAYNKRVDELEDTINTFEEKTSGVASNGEVWGGTAADIIEGIIKNVRNKIVVLRSVTATNSKTVDTISTLYQDTETDVADLFNEKKEAIKDRLSNAYNTYASYVAESTKGEDPGSVATGRQTMKDKIEESGIEEKFEKAMKQAEINTQQGNSVKETETEPQPKTTMPREELGSDITENGN